MKRATQLQVKQFFILTVIWMALGVVIAVYDHLVLHTSQSLGTSDKYSLAEGIFRNLISSFIGSMLGGSFLVFFVNVKYRDKPYGYTIMAVLLFFIFVMIFITLLLATVIVPRQTGLPLSDPVSQSAFKAFVTDSYPLKSALVWIFIVAITQLLLQVSSKFGQGTFWNIIRGKYNTPKEEKRIFMFLDLNSSTAIAEELGDETYHALLQDFFSDITDPIINNMGNIYQYVGDEVVVAWTLEEGIENAHCLKCFFDMKQVMKRKEQKYIRRYGLVPTFKAGLHCGRVVAGEIGIIKRDITYSGDVLNTTSRIQSMCKELNVEILASSNILKELILSDRYTSEPLGVIKLRGKSREIALSTLRPVF
ncbi:adenylate/guanylate cyclase domain-containing protein [Fulvivirga ulvae]|uniref:adenylate/guanylate cyclase domain-containing protein n=1 Tax=Fulvivirga ulvae TaxID=2904245 RepID=UPI001F224B4C|nr:adenylate/guanylate cyclase domain-containing protein [Fulvivirga ulvae]UII34661.1 adenylate/guanylate cyclase domain-containing protein [Fulvivirga ulvae]